MATKQTKLQTLLMLLKWGFQLNTIKITNLNLNFLPGGGEGKGLFFSMTLHTSGNSN